MPDNQPSEPRPTPSEETPSAASKSVVGPEDQGDRPKKARRTFLTQNACTRCRQKKSKCDGKRPTCARCEKHGADCVYDVAQEGVTRMQNLQNQLHSKTDEHGKLKQLFDALQRGSDQEATTLLARLRLGDSIDDLLSYVGVGQQSSSSGQLGQSPAESQQGSEYLRQWPSSPPIQEGYWTSQSEASSRNPSQSSVPQIDTRLSSTDSTLAIREGYRQQESQGGYFQQRSPRDMRQQGPNIPYGSGQWQSQEDTGDASPYYTDPSSGQRQRGKHPREQGQ